MNFLHHDWAIDLADAWWAEAGMDGFKPARSSYRPDPAKACGQNIVLVAISDIEPVRRTLSDGVFNDNGVLTARQRVVSILNGFRRDEALPPVEVVQEPSGALRRYKLTAGVHRLYCSLVAGFTHVPTIDGFDMTAPRE